MPERMPTKEEWDEWLIHPCTKRLRLWAEKSRLNLMEAWADGNFTAAFDIEMAVKNAAATGACSIYADLKDPNYEQIVIGASDEIVEQVGTDTVGPSGTG